MKVHICARRERRDRALRLAAALAASGHEITSRWLGPIATRVTVEEAAGHALADLMAADCVVLIAESPWQERSLPGSCDRHVEFGYALRAGKKAFVLGPRETGFCQLSTVQRYRTFRELIRAL